MALVRKTTVNCDLLEVEGRVLPLNIRRNRRARRMYLRYNPTEHSFSLTLPQRVRLTEGVDFVETKGEWIAHILSQLPKRQYFRVGMTLPLLGKHCVIAHDPELLTQFALKDGILSIGGVKRPDSKRIEAILKKISRHELSELAHYKASLISKNINRITLRDTSSRWGSCSSHRNLMFSWRLIFAPYGVLNYVVSHEVAHLKHMHHKPSFWETVECLCPD